MNGQDKVKAIVCYTIAPRMRQKGIATQLLQRVCEEAAAEGYTYVEAYPGTGNENIHRNYHGPYSLYEKIGFSLHKELEDLSIVRKYL
jgi:GNAT superfamily N-acetyltransferase